MSEAFIYDLFLGGVCIIYYILNHIWNIFMWNFINFNLFFLSI